MYNDPSQSQYGQYNAYGQPAVSLHDQHHLHRPNVQGSSAGNREYTVHTQQLPSGSQQARQQQRQPSVDRRAQRSEMMQSIRKHRSLDGSQFLRELDSQAPPPPPPSYGVPPADPYAYDQYSRQGVLQQNYGANMGGVDYTSGYPEMTSQLYTPKVAQQHLPAGYGSGESDLLKRENAALNEKLNYMMNSIKTFWSPELKRERQGRKDDSHRLQRFQDKVMQQATEIQQIRQELDRREKDITELMADNDMLDMEDELRQLRKQLIKERQQQYNPGNIISPPKDYTDKSMSTNEYHTMIMKLEKSEMALAEKQRELQNNEVRLKGMEEQNKELEKRLDIIGRSNVNNDAQVKLLQDDVNRMRQKLETRNQLIESKENAIRLLEKDVDNLRQQLQEGKQTLHEHKTRIDAQQLRVDQLDTLLREREGEIERLKQRLHQQPSTRIEAELRQQIHNLELDKRKLQEQIDNMRLDAEKDKQQQLQVFQEETRQLRSTIEYLQKDLADRQILLASQNEKISQLDANGKVIDKKLDIYANINDKKVHGTSDNTLTDLDEARKEVDHLLRTVQSLEKEKQNLLNKLATNKSSDTYTHTSSTVDYNATGRKGEGTLKIRIEELEEALRESVGITAEKDKQLTEQKNLIQQLTGQLNELYKDPTRRLKGTKTDADVKAWEDERQRYQRQLVNLRKEVTMAAIREKEACIQLLQGPPEPIKEKVEILARQKEQLRHRLLTQNNEQYSTSETGPYLANVWMAAQQTTEPSTTSFIPNVHTKPLGTAGMAMGTGMAGSGAGLGMGGAGLTGAGGVLAGSGAGLTMGASGITGTGTNYGTSAGITMGGAGLPLGASGLSMGASGLPISSTGMPLGTATSQPTSTMVNGTSAASRVQHYQQQQYANYVASSGGGTAAQGTATLGRAALGAAAAARPVAGVTAGGVAAPVNVTIPQYGTVPSAPASFTYGNRADGGEDEGIWA
ncbi:unnamed protein product [Bursaphelenchus okinawaensis]|uniref:Uncharacterized protein n=1 Tax=Bursaphelenchus okinawaensis TaxID=465554 RepID=A0A811KQ41_9BILA|nr:unnamed protein product [Bursaphelenchus okinawaensis]CAG9109960.1 unnamed protein product [Bursaphelenchus okinawaensis]